MRLGIRTRIAIGVFVATLIPMSGLYWNNFTENTVKLENSIKGKFVEYSQKSIQKLDDWVETNEYILRAMGEIPNLSKMEPTLVKENLKAAAKQHEWVRAFFVTDLQGQQKVRSNDEKLVHVGEREYFKDAMAGRFGQQLVISKQTGQLSLQMSVALKDFETGDISGTMNSSNDMSILSKAITKDKVGTTGYRFILSEDGRLLAHYDEAELKKAKNGEAISYENHPLWTSRLEEVASFKEFEYAGEKWIGIIERSKLGWYVASVQAKAEALKPIRDFERQAGIVFGGSVLLIIVLSFGLGTLIVYPMNQMKKVADDITKGKFNEDDFSKVKAKLGRLKSKDEFGQIADSIRKVNDLVIASKRIKK